MINHLAVPIALLFLAGCSTNIKPLPDGGPTSAQLIGGVGATAKQSELTLSQSGLRRDSQLTASHGMSSLTQQRLDDLNSDFKQVPNPQIIGYVAPHFNQADMPVPGYFTVFRLYPKDSYALFTEDAATGFSEVRQ